MSSESLFAQYQIAVERCRNLQSTLEQKEKQWKEIDKQYNKTIKLVKALCITILQNDKEENQKMLGENYKLGKTNDVIEKASKLYQKYITEQTSITTNIVKENKKQQEIIDGLQSQLEILMAKGLDDGSNVSKNGNKNNANGDNQQPDNNKPDSKPKYPQLPKGMNDADKNGDINIEVEGDDNVDSGAEDEVAESTTTQKPTAQSVATTVPKDVAKKARERKKKAFLAHTINLNDFNISEEGWEVLRLIGEEGISRSTELIIAITEKFAITENKARNTLKSLVTIHALQTESIANPLHSKFSVYYLDDIGIRLFQEKFNKKPIVSEAEGIAKKHANCIHGYGIFFVAEQIKEDDYFAEVIDNCPTIRISAGVDYVPDIMAKDKNGKDWYFEYELGHHTQKDFNAKCMKMEHQSNILNFITPNGTSEKILLTQISKWIEGKGAGYFKNKDVKIRLTSALRIKGCDIRQNDCWHYIFEPRKRYTDPRQIA